MYNLVVREFLDMKECRFYTSPIKTDEDRIKPRKKRSARMHGSEYKRLAIVCEHPFTGEPLIEFVEDLPRKTSSVYSSYRRTKNIIFDLCMSNRWEFFLTFTFRKECVDRYSFDDCSKKMKFWLNNVKKNFSPNLKYVIVPEQHKDGAWHFHGVFADFGNLTFVDSGRIDRKGRIVYNLYEYKFGFTTATKVSDNLATCLYVQKYITKDMCNILMNKKRYWCSRNLDRPKVSKRMVRMELDEIVDSIDAPYEKYVVQGDFYDIHRFSIYTTNTMRFLTNEAGD